MSLASSIRTIAVWEMNRSMTTMGRGVLPLAAGLLVLLVLVTAFAAESGIHMQDGIYRIGIDDPDVARIVDADTRFTVETVSGPALWNNRFAYDVVVIRGEVYAADTGFGRPRRSTRSGLPNARAPSSRRPGGGGVPPPSTVPVLRRTSAGRSGMEKNK